MFSIENTSKENSVVLKKCAILNSSPVFELFDFQENLEIMPGV